MIKPSFPISLYIAILLLLKLSLSQVHHFNIKGISVQKEKMYVIQKKSICVFQYFAGFQNTTKKVPTLIKEILLPFEISKYIITEKYICIKSNNKTQIRDNEFEKVFYSQSNGLLNTRNKHQNQDTHNSNNFTFDTVGELQLESQIVHDDMISWKVITKRKTNSSDQRFLREYWSERYNILTKHKSIIKCRSQMIDPTNKNRKNQICKSPVFVNQLGYIQNFYIWPVSNNDIQIGIFYNFKEHQKMTENHLYEICSFQLRQTNIKNIFHYDFKSTSAGRSKDGPHLFFAVCQNPQTNFGKQKSMIKIVIFEILPEQKISNDESINDALNNCLDQFNQLRKQKKSQQSISNCNLLNELLNNEDKSSFGSSPNKPTIIVESFTLKNSGSLKRVFYNPSTKVLWINDSSYLVYKIKFVDSGDIKAIKERNLSFIENLEGLNNGQMGPDLQGIMYDNYPIFKVNSFSLEIGLNNKVLKEVSQRLETHQEITVYNNENEHDEKQVIEFDDKELQKIEKQNQDKNMQFDLQKQVKNILLSSKMQTSQVQIQTQEFNEGLDKQKTTADLIDQQTQTQISSQKEDQSSSEKEEKHIHIDSLSQLLKELNFNKVEDVLIRFSTLFSANVTKNINKLRDFNNKAKQEIKIKINADIFDLIKEVFSSLMNDALAERIEKEVSKAREFVEKVFNKHIEHFNLMIMEQKIKEQNIKKSILQEQLRSIDVIKEASFKFLDVTKIRQMQKIAYNEVVVESIREVGKKVQTLQNQVNEMARQSEEIERKVISQVKEIKDTFKLLIELQEDDSKGEGSQKVDDECQESGFESEQDSEQSDDSSSVNKKQEFDQRRIPHKQGVQGNNSHPYFSQFNQPMQFNQRVPNWHPYHQTPANYPYPQIHPPFNPPPQSYYPVFHPSNQQSYPPHNGPYAGTLPIHQPQYFPPPNVFHPPYSEIKKGSQKSENAAKVQRKKRRKSSQKMNN